MKSTIKETTPTSTSLTIVANHDDLAQAKDKALARLSQNLKLPGFRPGKVPANVAEKHVDQAVLLDEVLQIVVPQLAGQALDEHKLVTAVMPKVNVTKVVPYDTLEIEVLAEYVGDISLGDYKKISKTAPQPKVSQKEIDEVLERMRRDMAERKEVERAAKDGDQVWIDFEGKNAKGQPVQGASGQDYPLLLGSQTFIPGFEEQLIGCKAGEQKQFKLTFPEDYAMKVLAGSKVTFSCSIKKVQEVILPKLDVELAAKVGSYKTIEDLSADIKKHLLADKTQRAELELESEVIKQIASKTKVEIPEGLIDEQLEHMLTDQQSNLKSRGLTYEDWLKSQGLTDEAHKKSLRETAIERLKGGIILSEISKREGIEVSEAEIDQTIAQYKQQFASDARMQAELQKPAARRDIAARLVTDKALARLRQIVIKKVA